MAFTNMLTMNHTYRSIPADKSAFQTTAGNAGGQERVTLADGYGYDIAGGIDGAKLSGDKTDELKRRFDSYECQTCANRKYVDGSNDPGVSFKTPGKVSPQAAASVVSRHENEHVSRNRAKAQREGGKVVSQSVIIKTAICPECHRSYVSGGETRTVTSNKVERNLPAYGGDGARTGDGQKGQYMDTVA